MVRQTFDGVKRGLRRRRIGGPRWKIFKRLKEMMRRSGRCGENELNRLYVDGQRRRLLGRIDLVKIWKDLVDVMHDVKM
ncbi:hypothetical protein Tco_0707476 [Tanacetum coccineum]|uniref:Uncharacterized protein n=1 Tax=Tanacetum coccineum TaxID=301880 RepID=A0ABQ4YCF1_9ASTR